MKRYIIVLTLILSLMLPGCSSPKKPVKNDSHAPISMTGDEDREIDLTPQQVYNDASDFRYTFDEEECTITGYIGESTEVSIPDQIEGKPVTTISIGAFKQRAITKVTVPEGVTMIMGYAFYGCTKLESITLPDTLKYIGTFAFSDCISLTSIVIPEKVTWIENSTFFRCSALTSVTLGNSVECIELHAFDGCTSLKDINIPDSITIIEDTSFSNCKQLNEDARDKINTINPKAFTKYF
jgi:hypothetical protein